MLKIVVAMLIGAGFGAAVTHELMSRPSRLPADTAVLAGEHAELAGPAAGASAVVAAVPAASRSVAVAAPAVAASSALETSIAVSPVQALRGTPATDTQVTEAASFEQAFAAVLARDEPGRLAGLGALAQHWLVAAPTEAIAALDRLSDPMQRQVYLSALASAAIVGQPDLLTAILSRTRGIRDQGALMGGVHQGVRSLEDPEPLLAIANLLPGSLRQSLESAVFSSMAEQDPLNALARVEAMPAGEARQRLLLQSMMQLVNQDPGAALTWLSARAGSIDAAVYQGVGAMLSRQNPDLAAQFAASVPESARASWITATAGGMAARDVDAAMQWLSAYRTTPYYDDALAGIAQQVAAMNPARAAQLLADLDMQSVQGRSTLTMVTTIWSHSDPDAAFAWARELPRGDARDSALIALAPALGEQMLAPAALSLFDAPQLRANAMNSAIVSIGRTDPQRAETLIAEHITDPNQASELSVLIESGFQPAGRFATFVGSGAIGAGVSIANAGLAPGGAFFYTDVPAGGPVPQIVDFETGSPIMIGSAASE